MRISYDEAHRVVGRTDEVLAYVQERQRELRDARVPVWEADRADQRAVDRALETHLRTLVSERLGRQFGEVRPTDWERVYCESYSGSLTPQEFRSFEEVRAALEFLDYPTTIETVCTYSVQEEYEDGDDEPQKVRVYGPRAIRVTARIADRKIVVLSAL